MNLRTIKHDKTLINEELIEKAKSGDEDAKNLLFKNNIPLVRLFVEKYRKEHPEVDFDEMMSIGFVGMTRAYNAFDLSKNVKFSSLLKKTVFNLFSNFTYRQSRERYTRYSTVSLDEIDEETDSDLHEKISCEDWENDFEYIFESDQASNVIQIVNDIATTSQKEIFYKHYFENKTFTDIAAEKGVSREAPSQLHRNLIKKLKSHFNQHQLA